MKKKYLGIQILRTIFCFHIAIFHCINHNLYQNKIIRLIINDVSNDLIIFFMISFYFSTNYFISRNINRIKQRFQRLLIPYVIWPFIFFIMNNSINIINNKKFIVIDFKFLYYQYLIGNGIYFIFWFQFNLIFISIFFAIISSPFYRIFFQNIMK